MAGQGSLQHKALSPRLWARTRTAALERAGWKSELSGLRGKLEVHHRVKLEDGGAPYDLDNLMVLTRDEHIQLHRHEDVTPEQLAWNDAVDELLRRTEQ